jgi:hypothetical protein
MPPANLRNAAKKKLAMAPCSRQIGGFTSSSRQQAGAVAPRPSGATQHSDQRSIPRVLRVAGRRCLRSRDNGLPLIFLKPIFYGGRNREHQERRSGGLGSTSGRDSSRGISGADGHLRLPAGGGVACFSSYGQRYCSREAGNHPRDGGSFGQVFRDLRAVLAEFARRLRGSSGSAEIFQGTQSYQAPRRSGGALVSERSISPRKTATS